MAPVSPETTAAVRAQLGIPPERLPRSVAIIMDGNGRWARQRGLPRTAGHAAGAEVVRRIVTDATRIGLGALTLYSFSVDNWHRPTEEVSALMDLYARYLVLERKTLVKNNIRFRHIGRRQGLPPRLLQELDESARISSDCTGMYLCLALNYGSRLEIVDGIRRIVHRVAEGDLNVDDIDEQTISDSLDTADVPDPDLLIRTSGELRLSNFLLWQLSYAEFHVTNLYWPDFNEEALHTALKDFASRNRRFGRLDESNT